MHPAEGNKVLSGHQSDARACLEVAVARLDQQDDRTVVQDLVRDTRRCVDGPESVEIRLRQQDVCYAGGQSNAGRETAWLMTLVGVGIPPAIHRILEIVIRCASPGNGLIPQTVTVSSNAQGVT